MKSCKPKSCYIIGDDKFVISCAEILLEKQYRILGIISSVFEVQSWSSQHSIPCFKSLSEFKNGRTNKECDFLFSIINYQILPNWVLALAKNFAINYHDSLLPQYAGIHATSWALINEETTHGITWHIMDERLDTGDILKQASTKIDEDETVLSLNLKCHHLALTTFPDLLDELANNRYQRIPQDLKQRSYFERYKKPPANGWIDWNQSAQAIDRLCRALQFGPTVNRLATAKFKFKSQVFIIEKQVITEHLSNEEPGTIVNLTSHSLQIATQTHDLIISKFHPIEETSSHYSNLNNHYDFKIGAKLKVFESKENCDLDQVAKQYSAFEGFWIDELEKFKPITIPFLNALSNGSAKKYLVANQIKINKTLLKILNQQDPTLKKEVFFLTLCLVYLYRLNSEEGFSVNYQMPISSQIDLLISEQVPMYIDFSAQITFWSCLRQIQDKIKLISNKKSYFKDVHFRYPNLSSNSKLSPVCIAIVDKLSDMNFIANNQIIIVLETSENLFHVFVNESLKTNNELTSLLGNFSGHLESLLASLNIQGFDYAISKLNLLTSNEYHCILKQWNQTHTPFCQDKMVYQLFEEQVIRTPQKTAISCNNTSLSYEELNHRSNQLAHHLRKKGISRETIVAICLDRGIDMVIALLAVLKAGGSYVPIDPDYPNERVKFIVNDSQAMLVISHSNSKISRLFPPQMNLKINDDWSIIEKESTNNLVNITQPSDLIYIIYTSGSTGQPKGVLIENQGVINCLFAIAEKIKISAEDKFLAVTPLSFDVAALDYYLPLSFGASIFIVSETDRRNGETLIRLLEHEKISAMQATPATWQMLVIGHWKGAKSFKILTAGEALSKHLADKLQKRGVVFNIYGPTEATIYATLSSIQKNAPITIGKPIANTQVFVLNKEKTLQPIGVPGELYISGLGVARGYLNNAEGTKDKFIEDLIIEGKRFRAYKTGDLVRWLSDGNLEYLGRIDNQIKIRGYRIELGEIENNLLDFPAIRQAVVIPHEEKGSKQLIAYIKKENSLNPLKEEDLKKHLLARLPDFMIPNLYIEIIEFPLSNSGKIQRNTLLQMYPPVRDRRQNAPVSPTSPIENRLCDIWQNCFGIEQISTRDNFFHLGGDSILAMQIASRARQHHIRLTVKQIFVHPTIEELASIIDEDNEIIEMPQLDEPLKFPLAPIQFWFFSQDFLKKEQWGQLCLIDVMPTLDPEVLQECLRQLIIDHEALRINFQLDNGIWEQQYGSPNSIPFYQTDIPSSLNQDEFQQYIRQRGLKIQEQFNLRQGPLLGAELITVNKIPKQLLIVGHHLVIDGISWRILCQDLLLLYKKMTTAGSFPLLHKTSSYGNWIQQLFLYNQATVTKEDKLFWLEQKIANPLPKDFAVTQDIEKDADNYTVQLTIQETQLLLSQSIKDSSIKTTDILLATLARVLEHWTENNNLLIDLESHGRDELNNDIDISNTVGWFTSIYPLYLEWPVGTSLALLIEIIKEQTSLIRNYGITYGALRYSNLDNDIKNSLADKPKSEIVFNYWGQFSTHLDNDLFRIRNIQLLSANDNHRPYILDISCWISNKHFNLSFNYNKQQYKSSTIKTLVDNYLAELRYFLYLKKSATKNESTKASIDNDIEGIFPLSSLQKGLLFHTLQAPTSGNYIIQNVWKSDTSITLCLNSLQLAFNFLVSRHQVLRTSFRWEDAKEPSQVIKKTAEFSWNIYDWEENISHEPNRLHTFLEADLQAGFDLSKASLLRVTVIRLPDHYYLIFTVPHILLDGWSLAILVKELNVLYAQISNNTSPTLPSTTSYSSFIKWQYKQDLSLAQPFWTEYLKGFLAPTNLSIKHEGVTSNKSLIDINEFSLSQELTHKIKFFCQQKGITVNTFFQGVWGLILHYYSQSNDIVYGVTLTERNSDIKDAQEIVGLLINTLPFRSHINKETSADVYLQEIQNNFIHVASYHYTPLTTIQECSEVSNGAPLFDTILVFENFPNLEHQDQIFKFNDIKIIDPTHYSLACTIIPTQNIKIKLAYDNCKIQMESIDSLRGHIQTLITTLMEHPQQSVSCFNLLTEKEKQQILIEWNATQTDYPSNKTVQTLFEEQVEKTPDKTALVFKNQALSYKELNDLANQMANYLLSKNIKPNDFIVVCIDRCLEMVVAILGTLKMGGVYIPVDPNYPAKRINDILQDANPAAVITKKSISRKDKLNVPTERMIFFEDLKNLTSFSLKKPEIRVEANQLAYIIYTSGSTGKPKGVLIEHRSLVNFLYGMQHQIKPSPEDNILALTSISFDISGLEIYLPLIVGAKCIIARHGAAADGNELKEIILENKITILQATPMTWKILLESGWENKSITQILCGGEALPSNLAEQLLQKAVQVWNLYGPTETTIWSTMYSITHVQKNKAVVPIGQPIINTQLYILDPHFQPVPVGIVGELYIGGEGLARGYLNNPLLTQIKFVTNPFSNNLNDKLYRTGDIVRRLPDGNVEYVQRIDDQVKVNGFRIELSDIQAQLQEHPAIKQAVVIIQGEDLGKKYISAYLLLATKTAINQKTLRSFLQQRLPSYMIPTYFIFVKTFPTTPNGKIDKKALAEIRPYQSRKEDKLLSITKKEKILIAIWEEVLGIQQINIKDNFFELGGHSLSALQILTKVNQHFQIDLPLRILFENPSIEELEEAIQLFQSEKKTLLAVTSRDKTQIHENCLITLQPKGNRTPLFLIHPVGGTVFWYVPLIKYLQKERPIYGIQDLGVETGDIPFESIPEMASFYIKVIQKVQPHGPYYLGGASAGANISIEIAYQLNKMNESVKFIGLLDGWAFYPQSLQDRELFEAIMRKQYNAMHNMFVAKGVDAQFLLKLQWARSRINNQYIPANLPNKLTLFKAKELMPIFTPIEHHLNHWQDFSTLPIEIYQVPGDHESMFQEPNVALLGAKLNECLNKADENH